MGMFDGHRTIEMKVYIPGYVSVRIVTKGTYERLLKYVTALVITILHKTTILKLV